jgi:phytoene dehydrogenase-like protein
LQLGLTGFRDHLISTERTLALEEFDELRRITLGLAESASKIPAMAMRSDSNPVPLFIRHLPELLGLLSQPDQGMGPFAPYMNGPIFTVTDPWLRSWLDALAFSLSGVEAAETPASAMAYVLFDMHRQGGTLDYPKGGVGSIVDELVRGVGGVELSRKVDEIVLDEEGRRVKGVRVRGELVSAKEGVICNAAIWELPGLLEGQKKTEELHRFLEVAKDTPFTRSYLHLHVVLNSTGLDVSSLRPHYTVFDKGLAGDSDHVVGDSNMIAVSNPCVLDPDLSEEGTIMLHAYCCGNEDYTIWEDWQGGGDRAGYEALKRERAECLWRR